MKERIVQMDDKIKKFHNAMRCRDMAYTELIKNFEKIRSYMNDFYVYGFKSREEFDQKSPRSYDNERRRIESYLGDYMSFSQSKKGKNIFISVDTRHTYRNPLYNAWKAKSFTDGDITLHFILLDILYHSEIKMTLKEITKIIDTQYLAYFKNPMVFDESTIRIKLKEYAMLGMIEPVKNGKNVLYMRREDFDFRSWQEAITFFSEEGQLGVIGSFIMDNMKIKNKNFTFKHHYITYALESEVLCNLFLAIQEKRCVTIKKIRKNAEKENVLKVLPLKISVSAQTGREYLLGYEYLTKSINSFRLDFITKVILGNQDENFPFYRKRLKDMQKNMWGVRCKKNSNELEYVEFTVHIEENEEHIFRRLEREKRCGTVERLDDYTCRFMADVYDSTEMIPWIRTYICRIQKMNFSNRRLENYFKKDIEKMYQLYGIGGDEE